MKSRRLTASDLCNVSEYSRHQMRGLLAQLPEFADRAVEAKVAAEFTPHDLLVITVCCRLEQHFGLKRQTVASLAGPLAKSLTGPRPLAYGARLVLGFAPPSARYVETAGNVDEGLVVPLEPVFSRVDGYLLPGGVGGNTQRELGLSSAIRRSANRGVAEVPAVAKKRATQR